MKLSQYKCVQAGADAGAHRYNCERSTKADYAAIAHELVDDSRLSSVQAVGTINKNNAACFWARHINYNNKDTERHTKNK